ncbi:MAG: GNAT family N-acetyltransferase [Deltaproteobacteria bacterium]|nr:GNAT family N-acetyltransferase [Deltaproteobacteria bacterium]
MINPLSTEIQVEPAQLADVEVMDRLEQEAFNTPWSRELLRGAIVNAEYIVRVLRLPGEGLLGFYIAHGVEERCNLDNLVVDLAFRNRGYGSLLIRDWIEQAERRGLARLTLQVNTANRDAQRLYEGLGFRATRLLVSYYPNGEDAYLMVREAPPDHSTLPGSPARPDTRKQKTRRSPSR